MSNQVHISQYFINDTKNNHTKRSSRDRKIVDKIMTEIDKFDNLGECYEYIYRRRLSERNRQEDYELFGIPLDAVVIRDQSNFNIPNKYYNKKYGFQNSKININTDHYKIDKYIRDENGIRLKDGYGNYKEKNKFQKFGANIFNNAVDSKVGKSFIFVMTHLKFFIFSLVILIICIALFFVSLYGIGMLNSMGTTPFAMCDGTNTVSSGSVSLSDAEIEEMMKPEYWGSAIVQVGKSKGWTQNAILGTLSYILAEGGNGGTFSYESNYLIEGPGGVKMDTTLNNEAWLQWLKSEKTMNDQIYAYRNTGFYKNGKWAMGIGLTQESDVYNNYMSGQEDDGATQLITRAIAAGVPWQDPTWQISDMMDFLFPEHSSDSDYKDPTTYSGSAEEYCRRVCTFIGMPGWHWNDSNSYIDNHVAHMDEAVKIYENTTGTTITSLSEQSINYCDSNYGIGTGGNATLADAAVSLASGTTKILWDSDGYSPNLHKQELKTYKEKHDEYSSNREVYASCDISVATAVHWAGVDEDFPDFSTRIQYDYLNGKGKQKWKYVGDFGKIDLQPGDILITKGTGHIKMYVGNEAVKKRFPDSDADMYAGSYQEYFPYVYKDSPNYDTRPYAVYRNIKSDKNVTIKTEDKSKNNNDNNKGK